MNTYSYYNKRKPYYKLTLAERVERDKQDAKDSQLFKNMVDKIK